MTDTLEIILWESLAVFLIVGAFMGIATSLLLIFKPHFVERINRVANRWISMRHLSQLLDRSIRIERWFYRHHRPFGIFITLGACYIIAYFGLLFDKAAALQRLSVYVQPQLLDILLDALSFSLLLGGAAALIVGLVICLRPSLLRGVEETSNQWISTRRATKMLDISRDDRLDQFVLAHAPRVGWLLLLGSVYLFFAVFRWLV